MINKRRLALTFALLATAAKGVFTLLVRIIPSGMQSFVDWVAKMHFIQPIITLKHVMIVDAIIMLFLTFIIAYCI